MRFQKYYLIWSPLRVKCVTVNIYTAMQFQILIWSSLYAYLGSLLKWFSTELFKHTCLLKKRIFTYFYLGFLDHNFWSHAFLFHIHESWNSVAKNSVFQPSLYYDLKMIFFYDDHIMKPNTKIGWNTLTINGIEPLNAKFNSDVSHLRIA